jgi:hypothetical protein
MRNAVELLRVEAARLLRGATCPDTRRFLVATTWLPILDDRTIYERKEPRGFISARAFAALPEGERGAYQPIVMDSYDFYYTRYGSPQANVRWIELLCQEASKHEGHAGVLESGKAPPSVYRGRKLVDFGFGSYGHLRNLALVGAHVTGIEVDPRLEALYSEAEDVGVVEPASLPGDQAKEAGSLTLAFGRWPGDASMRERVGKGYDFFVSKNTLKKGYVTPEREVDKRMLIDLGVTPEEFLGEVARVLRVGGYFMIYNICPKQAPEGEPYKPMADGRSPFTREQLEAHGFEVLSFDQDDTAAARVMGKALSWDSGNNPMDLENDLFAMYTLARKRGEPATEPASR